MSRRLLLVVIALLGAVSVATGLLAVALGTAGAPGGMATNATIDNDYRFGKFFWLATGLALWWTLRDPDRRALVTRVLLIVTALGAAPRLISIASVGWPHPILMGALALEALVVPLVIWWHARVMSSQEPSPTPPDPQES